MTATAGANRAHLRQPFRKPLEDPRLAALAARIRGEVRDDVFTRQLYSTDGSIYELRPLGVAYPVDEHDVVTIVRWANEHRITLLPRGNATSLAGQTVGEGLILDMTRHFNDVVAFDPERRRIVVQPGIVCDAVNAKVAPAGLRFAPDPSTSNRATIGGMIGNNSSGARSIKYGTTADCVASLRVVLSNGDVITTRPLALDGPELAEILAQPTLEAHIYRTVLRLTSEHAGEIATRFPDIPRNVSGYDLRGVVRDGVVDLTRLFAGSEGSLGIIVEAELKLEPLPRERVLTVLCFDDLVTAMEAVEPLRAEDVSAIELIDKLLLELAEQTPYAGVVAALPAETVAVLAVEVEGDDRDALVRLAEHISRRGREELKAIYSDVRADREEQLQIWNMRKAAVPIMFRLPGDPKPVPFIEDMAVAPHMLPDYIRGLLALFQKYDVQSVIYAHASVGCLHIRPVLNLKEPDQVAKMAAIAREACELVVAVGGAMSGEHGDGLTRTQWNRFMYGDRLWQAFRELKHAFDPYGLLNPGKVYSEDADLTRDLRYDRGYRTREWAAALDFSDQGSFQQAVELCNGCGQCLKDGGTMCPTFQALDEEILSTRGRANLIRGALSGRLSEETLTSPVFREQVLEYCIGCKGCRVECPSGVDMARIKSELLYHYNRERGKPLLSLLLAHTRELNRLGSALAPLSNALARMPGAGVVAEKLLGIDRRRPLPAFARVPFSAWMNRRGLGVPASPAAGDAGAAGRVLLLADCFAEYNHPQLAQAAVEVLQAAGYDVRVAPTPACCGRPAMSEGLLDEARRFAEQNVDALTPYLDAGWVLVGLEPSCTAMFRQDYADLLGRTHAGVRLVRERAFDVTEFLASEHKAGRLAALQRILHDARERGALPESLQNLAFHGHCHQKSMGAHKPTAALLQALTGATVHVIDAGCCGMAGSFGYKRKHYDLSVRIAERVRAAIERTGGRVVASGTSCSTQFADLYGWESVHPVEVLAEALRAAQAESPA